MDLDRSILQEVFAEILNALFHIPHFLSLPAQFSIGSPSITSYTGYLPFGALFLILAIAVFLKGTKRARLLTIGEGLFCLIIVFSLVLGLRFIAINYNAIHFIGYNYAFNISSSFDEVYYQFLTHILIVLIPIYLLTVGVRRFILKKKVSKKNHVFFGIILLCWSSMVFLIVDNKVQFRETDKIFKKTVIAIADYQDKYGKPPQKLADVVPEFMNKIPETTLIMSRFSYESKISDRVVNESGVNIDTYSLYFCFHVAEANTCMKMPIDKNTAEVYRAGGFQNLREASKKE